MCPGVFAAVVERVFDCVPDCISDRFLLDGPAFQSHQHQQCSNMHAETCGLHAYRLSSSCSRCAAPVSDRRQSLQACSVALRLQTRTGPLLRLKSTGMPQAVTFAWLAGSSHCSLLLHTDLGFLYHWASLLYVVSLSIAVLLKV